MKKLTVVLLIALMMLGAVASAETAPDFEAFGDIEWMLCSGAGGWATYMYIQPDGTFTGDYHDSEMGEVGEGYPNGTLYGCLFHGKLSMGEQVSDYAWTVHVDEVELDEGQVPEAIEDDIRYVTIDPYGVIAGNDMLLYLPGAPVKDLPEGFLFWAHLFSYDQTETLECYGLYDEVGDTGFIGTPIMEETAQE